MSIVLYRECESIEHQELALFYSLLWCSYICRFNRQRNMEFKECLRFTSTAMTFAHLHPLNGSLVSPATQTTHHPYHDPDLKRWAVSDFCILSRIPFERLRMQKRFRPGTQINLTYQVTEVNIDRMVREITPTVQTSHDSNNSSNKLNPTHNMFFFLQKNENFTDIDEYLNTIESELSHKEEEHGGKSLSQEFRQKESVQYIHEGKTMGGDSQRSLSMQSRIRSESNRHLSFRKPKEAPVGQIGNPSRSRREEAPTKPSPNKTSHMLSSSKIYQKEILTEKRLDYLQTQMQTQMQTQTQIPAQQTRKNPTHNVKLYASIKTPLPKEQIKLSDYQKTHAKQSELRYNQQTDTPTASQFNSSSQPSPRQLTFNHVKIFQQTPAPNNKPIQNIAPQVVPQSKLLDNSFEVRRQIVHKPITLPSEDESFESYNPYRQEHSDNSETHKPKPIFPYQLAPKSDRINHKIPDTLKETRPTESEDDEISRKVIQEVKQDVDRLKNNINLNISPSFNEQKKLQYNHFDKLTHQAQVSNPVNIPTGSQMKQPQKQTPKQPSKSDRKHHETKAVSKSQQKNEVPLKQQYTFAYEDLEDYEDPAIIEFSWDKIQQLQKK